MSSHHASSGVLRWVVASGGLLGLLLAVDGFVAFLFIVLSAVFGSNPPNPYVGAVAYVVLPVVMVIGGTGAWFAYKFWTATSPVVQETGVATR